MAKVAVENRRQTVTERHKVVELSHVLYYLPSHPDLYLPTLTSLNTTHSIHFTTRCQYGNSSSSMSCFSVQADPLIKARVVAVRDLERLASVVRALVCQTEDGVVDGAQDGGRRRRFALFGSC
jgi:hypothetical protein